MSGTPNSGVTIAQWTVSSTARQTYLMLGFVPDFAICFMDHGGTNPNILFWANKGGQTLPAGMTAPGSTSSTAPNNISQWLDADDHLLLTGSTGVVTRVTTGIKAYFGGDTLTADKTVDSNPTYVHAVGGTFGQSGEVTAEGLEFPAAILTNSAKNIVLAFRQSAALPPAGF